MPAGPQRAFCTTALDQSLLSRPFGVQTSWHVIAGAPCSGKTTVIDALASRGYRTVPESGRAYIGGERAKGRTTAEIIADGLALQRGVLGLQLRTERRLTASGVAFLDSGAPSCITYLRAMGLDPNAILAECFHHRYASVFLLDRFPFQPDGVRFEDDVTAAFIQQWLPRDYGALGYGVVRVPVLPVEERLAFILDRLAEGGVT